ncbi:MAG: hypothetical protein WC979_02625 [Candidatus Pacearchaeota archaeon]|jgi:hypothetical protein|nr:hypothetical protein [Clostridia bacterium]
MEGRKDERSASGYGIHYVESETMPLYSKLKQQIMDRNTSTSNLIITGFNEFKSKEDYDNFQQ